MPAHCARPAPPDSAEVAPTGPVPPRPLGARGASPGLAELVPDGWRRELASELDTPSFRALERLLADEAAAGKRVFPPPGQIFAALAHTPLHAVRVVLTGQDPYPTPGNANGLAFSVAPGVRVPASLKNLYRGLHAELGVPMPTSGDLTPWARQGVLLLNTVLTVREREPNSHRNKGWEPLTAAIVQRVNATAGPVVFLCLGAQAKAMAERGVDTTRHAVLFAPHPSPLNGKAFERAAQKDRLFTRANQRLAAAGRGPIDWALP